MTPKDREKKLLAIIKKLRKERDHARRSVLYGEIALQDIKAKILALGLGLPGRSDG